MKQKTFTKEEIINGLKKFTKENGHEPTSFQIDDCPYLPSSRQIQRRWGGLKNLRKEAGLKISDHTSGHTRSTAAKKIILKSQEYEADLHNRLVEKYFDKEMNTVISRQYAYQQYIPGAKYYANILTDTCIEDRINNHRTLIDFFSGADIRSLSGSVRVKLNKLKKYPPSFLGNTTYAIFFVCVTPGLSQEDLPNLSEHNITVLTLEEFTEQFLKT